MQIEQKITRVMHVYLKIVARSLNHCYRGNITVSVVKVRFAVNYIKISSVALKCFFGKFMSLAEIKRTSFFM